MAVFTACNKDAAPPPPATVYSWNEQFDTLANALAKGWIATNNSHPIGITSWTQGTLLEADGNKKTMVSSYPFFAQSANWSGKDFTMATYNSGANIATISCWLISPETFMKDGDEISFYTRTVPEDWDTSRPAPDRLQLWINDSNNSPDVGNTHLSTGSFNLKALDINPNYSFNGFPRTWTQYSYTVKDISKTSVKRRFAFRYFVEDGGPDGTHSFAVGIDNVSFVSQ